MTDFLVLKTWSPTTKAMACGGLSPSVSLPRTQLLQFPRDLFSCTPSPLQLLSPSAQVLIHPKSAPLPRDLGNHTARNVDKHVDVLALPRRRNWSYIKVTQLPSEPRPPSLLLITLGGHSPL